jgi:hypothetical protein
VWKSREFSFSRKNKRRQTHDFISLQEENKKGKWEMEVERKCPILELHGKRKEEKGWEETVKTSSRYVQSYQPNIGPEQTGAGH